MSETFDRFSYHQTLITELLSHCKQQLPFSAAIADSEDDLFMQKLHTLSTFDHPQEEFFVLGQELVAYIVANYPHTTPVINRDLFWYFGGICLHYMADDELQCFQQLEELLYEKEQQGSAIDFNQLKAIAFKLH